MQEFLLKVEGTIHTLSTPWVMGILNITPDSFYKESRITKPLEAVERAEQMLSQGAKIIDIGGYSSRPGASLVSQEEEWNRLQNVIPAVRALTDKIPGTFISVDTFRASVAEKAIDAGAHMINDISAGNLDNKMHKVVAKLKCPYIQDNPSYRHITQDIMKFFSERLPKLHDMGIHDTIVDVGFGFGKTLEHNYQLLRELHAFQLLGRPILTGISRKSMVYKALNNTAEESLNGSTALHMAALLQGSNILRVHDVKEAQETITLFTQLMPNGINHLLQPWER
jgi:dihydropteroate synthase